MSFLVNSNFEDATEAPWVRLNHAQQVSWGTALDPSALTGSKIGVITTSAFGGSVAQDVTISAQHVSAFAFVRSGTGQSINGSLAIWNLTAGAPSSTAFTVSSASDWTLVTNSFAVGPGSKRIRVELYVNTVNAPLYIDQVNAF